MVGMIVGHDHAGYRQSAQTLAKYPPPQAFGLRRRIAGVDNRPARTVFEQLKVDVVERGRKRHSQPPHPGSDRESFAGSGRRYNRKLQRCQAAVHI